MTNIRRVSNLGDGGSAGIANMNRSSVDLTNLTKEELCDIFLKDLEKAKLIPIHNKRLNAFAEIASNMAKAGLTPDAIEVFSLIVNDKSSSINDFDAVLNRNEVNIAIFYFNHLMRKKGFSEDETREYYESAEKLGGSREK